jgi:hypothetical protein
MFEFSSDSLNDYAFSFPEKPTPIMLERVSDPDYAFDSIIPTIPNPQQRQSIQKGELPSIQGTNPIPSLFGEIQYASSSDTESDPESFKLPFITNVYIASITVVGLFLLFRMIQK